MELIKYEFNRLFKQKTFYVLLCVCITLNFIAFATMKLIYQASVEAGEPLAYTALALTKGAISSSMITTISAIFVAIFVTEEYQSGTIKTVLSKGYSNKQIYMAKYIVSLCASLIFAFISIIVTFVLSINEFEIGNINGNYICSILAQLILVIAYHSIYFSISIYTRKLGVSIALNIVGPSIITALLGMGDALLRMDNFKLSNYWIDSFMSNVSQQIVENGMIVSAVIFGIVCSIAAIVLGNYLNTKKEL